MSLEQAALTYAERGYHVFPCRPKRKEPLTARGWKDSTRDERQILQWWDRRPDANIGIACGPTGICPLDIDTKYGADPEDVVAELDLERHAFVWTGEAPERSEKYPDSLAGARGGQVYFRGDLPTIDNVLPGCEIRGKGAYVIAPPSVHPSGVTYLGALPPVDQLKEIPEALRKLAVGKAGANGGAHTARDVGGKVQQGGRRQALLSLGGSVRRRGGGETELRSYLRLANEERCDPPIPVDWLEPLIKYLMGQEPGENNYSTPKEMTGGVVVPRFSIRQLREEDIRATQWAFTGYFPVGSLTGLVGVGGAGKGTFMAWQIARWTRGTAPGKFIGAPARVLIVGDEDSAREVWAPRIAAAGGDLSLVFTLEYDEGVSLDLVRDISVLEAFVVDHDIDIIYADQILDNMGIDLSSHVQKDVRQGLAPARSLSRRLEKTFAYTMHPNKSGGGALRDRAGGSGQFIDLPRSGLILGYHPDRDGYRALARGKGNMGAVPAALVFTIDSAFVTNPKTGEAVEVGVVANLEEDHDLTAEAISAHPPKQDRESKREACERLIVELGSDGEAHSRQEAQQLCVKVLEASPNTFGEAFKSAPVAPERRGRETWWRLLDV